MTKPIQPAEVRTKVKRHFQRVAIFGSADISDHDEVYRSTYTAAKLMAEQGREVVNGGGPGVMEAATDGAHASGGKVFTISFQPIDAPFFEGPSRSNIGDQDILASNYVERLNLLMEHADVFLIFRGGTGTLSEWMTVWLMAHIYYGNHKPFILFGKFWREVVDVIERNFYIGKEENRVFRIAETHAELLRALEELEDEMEIIKTGKEGANV